MTVTKKWTDRLFSMQGLTLVLVLLGLVGIGVQILLLNDNGQAAQQIEESVVPK